MKLREVTRKVISALEEKSGYLVNVTEEPALPTLATIRIARGNIPAHILSYRPGAKNESPDFAICWQCAFALRMYECPQDQRYLIAGNPEGDRAIDAILKAPNGIVQKYPLDKAQLEAFKQQLLSGLITHLRSVPIGLRVSETLTVDYPELLELETMHVEKELAIAKESLSARVREMMPAEIYNPTHTINAAYALFWAARLEKPEVVNPFHLDGFDGYGQQLLNIYESVPGDPAHDYELIDRWADHLKIRSWYSWLPYQAP
ncbi:MAG: hypothetical protein WC832_11705 [Anaerolineales bacterium]